MQTVTSVVGGRPFPAGEHTVPSVNPADLSEVVAEVHLARPEEIVGACRTASEAQRSWAAVPAPVRGRVVSSMGRLVEENKERLARLVTREIGKPYAEALGEVQEIIDTCDFFLGEGRRLYGQTVPSEMPDKQLFTFRMPVGTAMIITAGNFPVAVPSWYLVPALLCGNTVVWKPAEYAAASAGALYELFAHAGLPEGVLNLVHADGADTFAGLEGALAERVVDKVGFTGSSLVGSRIGELCGRHLQTPCLELGGKNPMVVTEDADLDLAVEAALFSGFGTAGQRCTSLGSVIVHESVHRDFLRRFDAATRTAPVGDPNEDVVFGPLLAERFAESYEKYLGWIGDHLTYGSTGVGRITEDNPREGFIGDPANGLFYHPVIVDGVEPGRGAVPAGDVRPDRGRHAVRGAGGGDRAGEPAGLWPVLLDLHDGPGEGVRVPLRDRRGDGQRQQLHLRCRGAPAVRRQRPVGQRQPPVGPVGARPVHPLAVAQLGLLRTPAEGPDGRGHHRAGPVLPPRLLTRRTSAGAGRGGGYRDRCRAGDEPRPGS